MLSPSWSKLPRGFADRGFLTNLIKIFRQDYPALHWANSITRPTGGGAIHCPPPAISESIEPIFQI